MNLPAIDTKPAFILAKAFSEEELQEVICYLELVRLGDIVPGPEQSNIGLSICYTEHEILAIQNRVALAINIKRKNAA